MNESFAGQPAQFWHPALQWLDMLINFTNEKAQLLLHPVGIILMACVLLMIGQYFASKTKFKREKDQLVAQIRKCSDIITGLQDKNKMHKIHIGMQLNEMIRLKANADRKLRQMKVKWKRKLAERARIALKRKLKHCKTFCMVKLAEREKALTSVKETCTRLHGRARLLETWYQEKCTQLKHAEQYIYKVICEDLKELKEEVIKWKEKCADAEIKLVIVQDSANTLAMAKAYSEAKMTDMEAKFKKAVLKSKPRLIDLHYMIVQRLPPAARPFASAVCFSLGLRTKISCADDRFEVTEAFRRWLECGSSVPRTWGGLLEALRRDFHYEEIPDTWVDDITKDLIYGGIAALPPPEHFCRSCHQDFSKEHQCYKIEDDTEGMIEGKEQSSIPPSQELVVP